MAAASRPQDRSSPLSSPLPSQASWKEAQEGMNGDSDPDAGWWQRSVGLKCVGDTGGVTEAWRGFARARKTGLPPNPKIRLEPYVRNMCWTLGCLKTNSLTLAPNIADHESTSTTRDGKQNVMKYECIAQADASYAHPDIHSQKNAIWLAPNSQSSNCARHDLLYSRNSGPGRLSESGNQARIFLPELLHRILRTQMKMVMGHVIAHSNDACCL